MGEGAWRFEHYGAITEHLPSLDDGKRGLIVGQRWGFTEDSVATPAFLSAEDLRFFLLFWDILHVPRTRSFDLALGPEADFLEAEGVLRRGEEGFPYEGKAPDLIQRNFADTFTQLDVREPGRWALGRSELAGSLVSRIEVSNLAIAVRLHHAIAVPDAGVPLDDVLGFRQQRMPELLKLRAALDEIAIAIAHDLNPELAEQREFNRLVRAVDEYLKASREWNQPLRLGSLTAKIKVDTAISFGKLKEAVGFAAAALVVGASPMAALGAGVLGWAAGAVALEPGFIGARTEEPYEYIMLAKQQLWDRQT